MSMMWRFYDSFGDKKCAEGITNPEASGRGSVMNLM
jgi:hypothetical protein